MSHASRVSLNAHGLPGGIGGERLARARVATAALVLAGAALVGACSREPPSPEPGPIASITPAASLVALPAAPGSAAPVVASAAPAVAGTEPDGDGWKRADNRLVKNAIGLGCSARSAGGWLRFTCRARSATGGKPKQAILDQSPAGARSAIVQEDLVITSPWTPGTSITGRILWTDTAYSFKFEWAAGEREPDQAGVLTWGGEAAVHRACSTLASQQKQTISTATGAAATQVRPALAMLLPRSLGECQEAGLGSVAYGLVAIAPESCGAEQCVKADLLLTRITPDGRSVSAVIAPALVFQPGNLKLARVQVHDWDDDGEPEYLLGVELEPSDSTKAERSKADPWRLAHALWTSKGGQLAPMTTVLPWVPTQGESLDADSRLDLLGYGPYDAWIPKSCGLAAACPPHLQGPVLALHAAPEGAFSGTDEVARARLKKSCPAKPTAVVASKGQAIDLVATAKQLACARIWGASEQEVLAQLTAAAADLCVGGAPECSAKAVLERWAKAPPPATLP